MSRTSKYQRLINTVLSDEKYKSRGIECVISLMEDHDSDEPRYYYYWYFKCGNERIGMPKVDQRELDLVGLRAMAKDVLWHHGDYNMRYGPKDSTTKKWIDRIFGGEKDEDVN